ncbi:ATP-binding cassette domain-containing protein, partial [Neisseria sp. P0017.S002]|uniref:ATP-binding cassette domain-containing protein n=1 Tax=Neisseria sp. P0017.S002 TaxID=3436778 RepID=UPI003F7D95A8
DRPILNNINFRIPKGNFAAVMGGSGRGKTTLMRLITVQIHPQSGKVLIVGRDLAAFSAQELYEQRRRMGVLFQHGALF